MSTFSDKLQQATNEDKQVNPIYVQEIRKLLPKVSNGGTRIDVDTIIYPEVKTDGIYKCYYIDDSNGMEIPYLLQLECKLDVDFSNAFDRANVLTQVCCYLEQIHDNIVGYDSPWEGLNSSLPKVIILGSKINCMALPTSILLPHAIGHFSGYKSASTAHLKPENEFKIRTIANDGNIQAQSIIYDTTDKECISHLCEEIVKLGKGLKITDDLNEHTISLAFDFFDMYVMDSKSSSKLTSREKVDLFIGTFFNEEFEESISRGQTSVDKLKIHGVEVKVNPDKYNQFKILYNMREYSRLEQKQITAITDRLIEDTDRRRKGDFYTPSIWVDEAHKLLDKNLGENWRDEYMVWDCAWGTGNLTRDYQFADLYCSTLQQEDLNIATRYNKNAVKFQYDFLNDDVEEMEQIKVELRRPLSFKAGINMQAMEPYINFAKILDLYAMAVDKGFMTLEEGQLAYNRAINILKSTKLYQSAPTLIDGLLGDDDHEPKKLLFLINPPYGTSGEMVGTGKEKKSGIAITGINMLMDDEELGHCRQQLYAQFIYRITKIGKLFGSDVYTSIFAPTLYMCSRTFEKLYNYSLYKRFMDGFMLQASQFADVKGNWAISFCLWGIINDADKAVEVDVKEQIDNHISLLSRKQFGYSTNTITDYIKEVKIKTTNKRKTFTMSNALNITDGECSICDENIGYLVADSTLVEKNTQFVMLIPRKLKGHLASFEITPENFDRICSAFTARALISGAYATWINGHDEYMIPNLTNQNYSQWLNDSVVYSVFNGKSNISSMRNLRTPYSDDNIQNEFFWMSVKDIADLAGGKYGTDDINTAIEDDIDSFGKERFVYKKLQTVTLSPDAQAVLDKATELLKSSFKYRKQFNQAHPEYHINTWDAGWYQIKGLLKQYDPEGLKQFNELYKQLEDRMRPLVYELGFLYK